MTLIEAKANIGKTIWTIDSWLGMRIEGVLIKIEKEFLIKIRNMLSQINTYCPHCQKMAILSDTDCYYEDAGDRIKDEFYQNQARLQCGECGKYYPYQEINFKGIKPQPGRFIKRL